MKTFLTLSMIMAVAVSAAAQPATQPPRESGFPETVSVTGTGRVTLVPDRFSFNVGVQTMAPTVEQAVNENNLRVGNVVAALKKAGATSEEIRTANFSIYPQQQYQQGQPPRVVGYQVSNSILVTRREIAEAGKLLQVAIGAGVNESSGLQFEVSDPSRGRDQGLHAAFDDARAKAAVLAQAAGRTLGRAMVITEGSQVAPVPRPMPMGVMAAKAEAVTQVPVESGTRELSYTVSVIFDLR
jgi:uncharacterized protein YggE